jgi:hypothetical protein
MQRRQAGASAVTVLEGNAALHGLGRDGDMLRGGDGSREPRQDLHLRPQEDEPASVSVDGFQRALLLEQHALGDALAAAPHAVQKRLIPLIADLYTMLRTPLFPRGSDRTIAAALVQTALSDDNGVYLHGVLASPTAQAELQSFLNCGAIFRRHGFRPQVALLLVQWENLVEMRRQHASSRARTFARQVRTIAAAAQRAGFADAIIPIAVEVDTATAEILSPVDFQDWAHHVLSAVQEPHKACPSLVRDVVWSTSFYARQNSLRASGAQQAWLDLAIRRAVGQRISAAYAAHPHADGRVFALLTSELHKRLLPCYAAAVPIVNIDARERLRAAPTAGVA